MLFIGFSEQNNFATNHLTNYNKSIQTDHAVSNSVNKNKNMLDAL